MTSWPFPLIASRVLDDIRSGRISPWIKAALRTKSTLLREVFARGMFAGSIDTSDIQSPVHNARESLPLEASESAHAAVALGTVWAAAADGPPTMAAGHRLLRAVIDHHGHAFLPRAQREIFAQVSYLLGSYEDVRESLGSGSKLHRAVHMSLKTDLMHPSLGGPVSDWEDALATPFVEAGLAALSVNSRAATEFDGLSAKLVDRVDGPMISVIMPCFRPDEGLLTSIRSILGQSHENLEVLLVDDASGKEYESLFQACAALDERVRLVRMQQNGGTYLARNAALLQARGEYITVQDADDWSHPSRLAEQVRLLRREPHAGGSRSDAIRAKDDLTHQWVGYSPRRPNASSLMFRRSDLERTGPFDAVRKGADSEFHERLGKLVGPVVDTNTPLAITRLREGTLSRSDFTYGWMHPDRLMYRDAYRSWHKSLGGSNALPLSRVGKVSSRPFPAPPSFLRGIATHPPQPIDLLLVADASTESVSRCLAMLTRYPDLRFGLIHMEDVTLGRPQRPEYGEDILVAARNGRVLIVSPEGHVPKTTAIVLGEDAMIFPTDRRVSADRVLVPVPVSTAKGRVSDLIAIGDGVRAVFGVRPVWCARDSNDRDAWIKDGWSLPLMDDLLRVSHSPE